METADVTAVIQLGLKGKPAGNIDLRGLDIMNVTSSYYIISKTFISETADGLAVLKLPV